MSKLQRSDSLAIISIALGIVGAAATGFVHYQIATSAHFDFMIHDAEFYLVLGIVVIAMAFAAGDLGTGVDAIRHLNTPHHAFARPLAVAGITVGVVDLFPALIILVIIIETLFLKLVQIKIILP